MERRIVVSALIKFEDKYLFVKQDKTDGAYPGTLHLPGGSLEGDESIEDGIRREVREETGLELVYVVPFDFDEDYLYYKGAMTHLIYLRFLAESETNVAIAASDAKEIVWLKKDEIKNSKQNSATIKMLKKLELI